MSELRYTETNAASDSAGRAFGLEGNLYLPVVLATVAAIGLFALLSVGLGTSWTLAAVLAATPLAAILAWIVGLKQGKPPGYDRDFLDHRLGLSSFERGTGANLGRTHAQAPEGRLVDGMIVFGVPERGGIAAKGFWLEPPDVRGASFARLNALQDQLKAALALVSPGRRLQFQWWPDSDYRGALQPYHRRVEAEPSPALRAVGNERVSRYWPRMLRGELRRERLAVFLSIEFTAYSGNVAGPGSLRETHGLQLREMAGQFEEFAATLRTVFGPETPVRPMDDLAHFACLRRFLNPSLVRRDEEDATVLFDPERTVQENCWHGDGIAQPDGGFFLDGFYHAILTLDRWPKQTRPGIVTHLTGLPFLEYCLTVTLTPAGVRKEIGREEQAAERLRGEYSDQPRASVLVALRKKERKIEQLASGFARPFLVTYIIRVWAGSRELLRERVATVQAAIHAMEGAQYVECALPSTAKKLFFASWPGWTHSSYTYRELYAEDQYLADLLPFSATFTGQLDQAEALFDGANLNLVGVSSEVGGSPQHALVCGMTGSGKSEFIHDLFLQTAGLFHYTLIADIGLSHRRLTEALGEKPIIVHPDANLTLNYLDTQRAPLTQLHVATAVALLARMVGVPENAEALSLRQAQLTQYVHQLYRDTFTDWSRKNPALANEVRRIACAVHGWKDRMPAGSTPLEAFVDLRDRQANHEDEALTFVHGLTEEAITRFAQEPLSAAFVAATACAYYQPQEFPTHSALVELLAFAPLPEHGEEVAKLATLLRAWCVNGQYGRLFDGQTTISLQRRIAHFELGLIPEPAVELKAAVGLLISGLARQHIISLPRALRKRALFEEVSQILDIPGGEQIVAESYAQLRKHRCWAVSVVQQYSRFRTSRIRAAVVGNTKQFFLLRQSDRHDMQDLAADVGLPESAVEAIQRYPLPEQQPAGKKFSSVCCFLPTAQPPQCGTLRHVQPQEESCAAS